MRIYSVGVDEMSDYNFEILNQEAFEWFVYDYTIGDWSGGGEAVALRKDGMLAYGGLGHCSCYGPIDDDWMNADVCTVDEFLGMNSDSIHDYVASDALKAKVKELLGV